MGRVVDVEINAAKALITLGSMYRNAADAIKEYVSNALDEWAKVRQEGGAGGQCKVYFTLSKNSITIDYNAPGMDEAGFEDALKHVVDSRKEGLDIPQIGRLGIGLWAFNQVGDRATFYSKRSLDTPTIKVVLTRNSSEAEFFDPDPGEEREIPGMTIEITGLFQDPTRRYGPVSQARLKHVMADRFDVYLRTGQLKITIRCGKVESEVEPVKLDLPEIGIKFRELSLATDRSKVFSTRFWFDPSGNGRVAIRHTGVVVIDDLQAMTEYPVSNSMLTSGYVKGFVDAEFLKPLPARAQFFEDRNLASLLKSLASLGPELEKEISGFQAEAETERVQGLFRRATRVAQEIFSQEEFLDVELIEGLNRLRPRRNGGDTKSRTTAAGNGRNGRDKNPRPRIFNYVLRRTAFKGDMRRRSRFSQGTVEINTNSPDFIKLSGVPRANQVAYVAMLLGKEIIAYNDTSGVSNEALDKLAAYGTQVLTKVWK